MTPAELDDLEALLNGASDAPWQWLDSGGEPHEGDELQDGRGEMVASNFRDDLGDNFVGQGGVALTDGRLCAALRNAAHALIDAARAAAEPREGLDVERLAKAIRDVEFGIVVEIRTGNADARPSTGYVPAPGERWMVSDWPERLAKAVAREYAALAEPSCDFCDESLPLVDGWHIREADPDGLEGIQRIPCSRR